MAAALCMRQRRGLRRKDARSRQKIKIKVDLNTILHTCLVMPIYFSSAHFNLYSRYSKTCFLYLALFLLIVFNIKLNANFTSYLECLRVKAYV